MNKKVLKTILKIIIECAFYWFFCFVLLFILALNLGLGNFYLYQDAFGSWMPWILCIVSTIVILSILFMRLFIKKNWLVNVIAYGLAISIYISCAILATIGYSRFEVFTTEKWIAYPLQRGTMYHDLEKNYDFNGKTADEVKALLGKPNSIHQDGTFLYNSYGCEIYVKFNGENAYYVYCVN